VSWQERKKREQFFSFLKGGQGCGPTNLKKKKTRKGGEMIKKKKKGTAPPPIASFFEGQGQLPGGEKMGSAPGRLKGARSIEGKNLNKSTIGKKKKRRPLRISFPPPQ